MGRKTEQAYYDLSKSVFTWHDERTLEVINAVIIWPNFSGKPNRYGNSARTFNLCIPSDLAAELEARGMRVREVEIDSIRDEKDQPAKLHFVNIKVNMSTAYPPSVTLISTFHGKKNRKPLDEESICELDSVDFKSTSRNPETGEGEDSTGVDCIINCYESRKFPGKVTGYLKKLFATQDDKVEFGGKYDDWDEEYPDVFGDVPGVFPGDATSSTGNK